MHFPYITEILWQSSSHVFRPFFFLLQHWSSSPCPWWCHCVSGASVLPYPPPGSPPVNRAQQQTPWETPHQQAWPCPHSSSETPARERSHHDILGQNITVRIMNDYTARLPATYSNDSVERFDEGQRGSQSAPWAGAALHMFKVKQRVATTLFFRFWAMGTCSASLKISPSECTQYTTIQAKGAQDSCGVRVREEELPLPEDSTCPLDITWKQGRQEKNAGPLDTNWWD